MAPETKRVLSTFKKYTVSFVIIYDTTAAPVGGARFPVRRPAESRGYFDNGRQRDVWAFVSGLKVLPRWQLM